MVCTKKPLLMLTLNSGGVFGSANNSYLHFVPRVLHFNFLVAFVHEIRVRLFFFVPEHRHGIQIKIGMDINHRRSLCYGPGRAASRATDWKRALSLSVVILQKCKDTP